MTLPATLSMSLADLGSGNFQSWAVGESSLYIPGIPGPMWGASEDIDPLVLEQPDWPAQWPSAQAAGYYYIDSTHPSATDTSNTYGYPNQPRLTIPSGNYLATTFAAGAYVYIAGGPYTISGNGKLLFTCAGTESQPVWIVGDPDNFPIIRGIVIPNGQYIIFENLKFDTNSRSLELRPLLDSGVYNFLHHVMVRDCLWAGPGTDDGDSSCINIQGRDSVEGGRYHNFVIYNNLCHDFGVENSATQNDYHAFAPQSSVDYVWIINNVAYNMGGDGCQVGVAQLATANRANYVYVGGNHFYNNRENAVDLKKVDYVVISSNECHEYRNCADGSSDGTAIVIHDGARHVWIINNEIYDSTFAIACTACADVWSVGNLIYNIIHDATSGTWNANSLYSDGACIHYGGTYTLPETGSTEYPTTGGIVNNTFADYRTGIQITTSTDGNYTVINNYFNGSNQATGHDYMTENSTTLALTTINNNTHVNTAPNYHYRVSSTDYTIAGFQALGKGANTLLDSSSSLNGSYQLSGSASSVGAGTSIATIQQNFFNTFGIELDRDIFGNNRVSATIDIGAHESA